VTGVTGAVARGTAPAPLIRLRALGKRFRQGDREVAALEDVSLDVAEGEFVALQGTSGSGKSTLLHVLGLLDRPTAGTYLLRGDDTARLDDDAKSAARNRLMGFVFQSFHLLPYATALENVLLASIYRPESARALRERARSLLRDMGLEERATFRPGRLSGGQQQRVALARALFNDPALILADEPTGQLDATTGRRIMEMLATINAAGRTVILATHDRDTAAFARRTIVLRDGRVESDVRR
jgi:putative ABC transport system ATP-binding protein